MSNQLMTDMVLKAWHSTIKKADELFKSLSDEEMKSEVAPNKNRALYLLGHLVAVNDMMLPLLGLGEIQFPELTSTFIKTPDDPATDKFTAQQLREFWKISNAKLSTAFDSLSPEEWFEKHTSVSEEDFANAPHRNKLNVLMSRTSHVNYHLGQLIFLKK